MLIPITGSIDAIRLVIAARINHDDDDEATREALEALLALLTASANLAEARSL